jgi:hypothetical protein
MKDYTKQYYDREYDELWYADTSHISVDKVQAFKCPPNDDDTRWVPEKGYSTNIGGTLQRTQEAAEKELRTRLRAERTRLTAILARIDAYLAK